jgi:hypothetical protein
MRKTSRIPASYEMMGIAATIPGLQHAAQVIQDELDSLRARLAALQAGEENPQRRRGRPRGTATDGEIRSGWPADPEERKREMARRMAKRKQKNFRATMQEAARNVWAKMTPEQRANRLAAMKAGRRKHPVVRLEKAS